MWFQFYKHSPRPHVTYREGVFIELKLNALTFFQPFQDVVTVSCDTKSGTSGVMSCLMIQVASNSKHMTAECKKRLMEIEYFLARDFVLDPKLYQ
jgi:hypothetical protein